MPTTNLVPPYLVLLEGRLDDLGLHVVALLGLLAGLAALLAPRLLAPLLLLGAETSPATHTQASSVSFRTLNSIPR